MSKMSKSKKLLLTGCVLLAAGLMAASSLHAATTYYFSGSACQPYLSQNADWEYTFSGFQNINTTSLRAAICPITGHQSDSVDVDGAGVNYEDKSTTGNVNCTLYIQNTSGAQVNSATRYSCATVGGCTTPVNSYTGNGFLNFADPLSAQTSVAAYHFFCGLPAHTGATPSLLRRYLVTQVNP